MLLRNTYLYVCIHRKPLKGGNTFVIVTLKNLDRFENFYIPVSGNRNVNTYFICDVNVTLLSHKL